MYLYNKEKTMEENVVYHAIIIISVLLFGASFYFKDIYRQMRGNSFKISIEFSFIGSIVGLIALLIINGIKFEYTLFSLIMALISTINGFAFTYFSFKALGRINLSLYSIFSMLGGMMLPFLQGIIFFGESITFAKIICVLLITLALLLTKEKGQNKKGSIYYTGVFVLNGMSGVLSKIFVSAPFEKVSSAGYSILTALCSLILSLIILLIISRKKTDDEKPKPVSVIVGAMSGLVNRIGNFLLIIALNHVDSSVQYPMVTGGVMIVSTLACFFGERKPSKKEVASVIISFIGLLILFLVRT
ncbi:MAG: hypothetical protein E7391_06775 [Ruminococcaceae bacterium]|nr:hypothetical protein [Oscillospiraceae bacterium]